MIFHWTLLLILVMLAISCETYAIERGSVHFEDCGSVYDIVKVEISSCSTTPCFIPINRRLSIRADFEYMGSPVNQYLKHEVSWILNEVRTKAHIMPEGCDGRRCPFQTPFGYGFTADIYTTSNMPMIRGTLLWQSLNRRRQPVVCFRVPIYIGLVN